MQTLGSKRQHETPDIVLSNADLIRAETERRLGPEC